MSIQPILSDADFTATSRRVGEILDRDPQEGSQDHATAQVLLALMRDWETRQRPVRWPDPVGTILTIMEERGLTRADLEPFIGGRGRVSEVLNRQRRLTLDMIRGLLPFLGLPAEALMVPYDLRPSTRRVTVGAGRTGKGTTRTALTRTSDGGTSRRRGAADKGSRA